jgi:hypothetical protein
LSTQTPETTEAPSLSESELALALPAPVDDPFLDFITGDWAGIYTLAGIEFEAKAEVLWMFNHQFVRGFNHSRGSIGLCESQEIWQPTKEKGVYKVWWFDSWGNAGVADGWSTEDGFMIHGEDPLVGSFRNTVTKNGPSELLFKLENKGEDGEWNHIGGGYYRLVDKNVAP